MVDFARKLEEYRAFKAGEPVPGEAQAQAPSLEPPGEVIPITDPNAQEVPCAVLTGCAGTGKTYTLLKRVADDPTYGVLCSSTGISAVNLGAITINSLLGYFDTSSLRDAWLQGRLQRVLHMLAKEYRWLVLDEMSMFSGDQLTILYRGMKEANAYRDITPPGMGILLAGDFCQLPPIHERWCFESEVWDKFAANAEVLTKVWRQGDARFLHALNAVRRGDGADGAAMLTAMGAEWHTSLDNSFDGTTILPKNDQVSRYNEMPLDRLPGAKVKLTSRRWGQQRKEWGENARTKEWGVPPTLELKVGAYVMILANERNEEGEFEYVNGDCGHVVAIDFPEPGRGEPFVCVKLARNGVEVYVHRVTRMVEQEVQPDGFHGPTVSAKEGIVYLPQPHYRERTKRYVVGQVNYFPLRLAYASTVHKSQSLTLDRVQVDFRNHFFANPAMLYVALSRCRSLEGLRLVGQPDKFVKHCKVDPKVVRWL